MHPDEKKRRIAEANGAGACPNCRQPLGADATGSGAFSHGVFCSLDCEATFHQDYFEERARASNRSQN
jgi:hypothetical protein